MAAKDGKPQTSADAKSDKPAAAAAAAAVADAHSGEPKLFALEKESELRFEVNARSKLIVTLLKGTAEMFGTELAVDKEYTFSNAKGAIFTWQGAELSVRQPAQAQATGSSAAAAAADGSGEWHGATVYVASDTPMVSYINAHAALENLRKQAESKKAMGPRVMIVGPGDSGKSTLTRILLSYAVRAGWKPTYVDLDVGQNGITIPGVLAASPVEHPVALEGAALYSSPPIAYFFGHNTPTAGFELYQQLVERLAAAVDARAKHPDARHAGAVINTCGLVDEKGQQLLVHAATAFRVDVILVLEDERLEYQLRHEPRLKHVAVAKLAKSGGVVKRESDFRKSARDKAIAQYFYGAAAELKPHLKTVPFKDVKVYRAGGQQRATASSMLPIGAKSLLDPNALSALTATEMQSLKGRVLGVSFAKKSEDLLRANCAGFVHVQAVDAKAQTITLLTPSPTPLPSQFLLTGTVVWADS